MVTTEGSINLRFLLFISIMNLQLFFGNVKEIESTRELVDQHHVWFLSRLFDFQM